MNLEELKSMSTADLLKLYNSMADRQVKRFASRADAERRTAELLRDKAEGESKPAAKVTGKKASKQASKPAQKAEGKKAGSKHIGAPRKEHSYEPISEGSKNYNPNKLTLHEKSARSIVFAKIASKPGITRRELEDKCDPEINVLASLSYLTKNGFITSKQA